MIPPSKVALQSLTESERAKGIVDTVKTTVKIRLLYPTRSPSGHSFSLPTNDIRNKPEPSPPAATVTLTVNKSTKNPVCSDPLFAYSQRDLQKPELRIVTAVALVSL